MLLKLRLGLKLFVMVSRVMLPGKTRSSPEMGKVPPLQLAAVAQLPLELPSQVLMAALAGAAEVQKKATIIANRAMSRVKRNRRDSFAVSFIILLVHLSSQELRGASFNKIEKRWDHTGKGTLAGQIFDVFDLLYRGIV